MERLAKKETVESEFNGKNGGIVMGVDTNGRIKGFVRHDEIFNFIIQKYDKNAVDNVKKFVHKPLSEIDWKYKINEHSEDNENWYSVYGRIDFNYHGEERSLFYSYDNLNSYENLEYYSEYGLKDMVLAETTYISLGYWGNSINIIKEIVAHFGGGWIDENDCDDNPYYPIEVNIDGEISPVIYVTMNDIYEKFRSVVVITK